MEMRKIAIFLIVIFAFSSIFVNAEQLSDIEKEEYRKITDKLRSNTKRFKELTKEEKVEQLYPFVILSLNQQKKKDELARIIGPNEDYIKSMDIFESDGSLNLFKISINIVEQELNRSDISKLFSKYFHLNNENYVALIEDVNNDGFKDILLDSGIISGGGIAFMVIFRTDSGIFEAEHIDLGFIGNGTYSLDGENHEIVFTSWTFKDKHFEKGKEILIPRYYFEARFKMVGDKIIEVQPPKKIMIENGKPEIEDSTPPPTPPGQEKKQ